MATRAPTMPSLMLFQMNGLLINLLVAPTSCIVFIVNLLE